MPGGGGSRGVLRAAGSGVGTPGLQPRVTLVCGLHRVVYMPPPSAGPDIRDAGGGETGAGVSRRGGQLC